MSSYAWKITRDHLAQGDDDEAGTYGPSTISDEQVAQLDRGEGLTFRMRDDDGELYYTGRIVGVGDDPASLDEEAFSPLVDFGTPNAGAVTIEYRQASGQWEVL